MISPKFLELSMFLVEKWKKMVRGPIFCPSLSQIQSVLTDTIWWWDSVIYLNWQVWYIMHSVIWAYVYFKYPLGQTKPVQFQPMYYPNCILLSQITLGNWNTTWQGVEFRLNWRMYAPVYCAHLLQWKFE